jgi:hypothetical protein
MATFKFTEPSPYKQERPKAPEVDFLYSRWVQYKWYSLLIMVAPQKVELLC